MFQESERTVGAVGFTGRKRATVINNVDPLGEGRVAVSIKQLRPSAGECDAPTQANTKKQLSKDRIENKDDNQYSEQIQEVNFIWARPTFLRDTSPTEKTSINQQVKGGGHQTQEQGQQLKKSASYNAGGGPWRVPRVGTELYVFFEDGDPQKCYWLPESPSIAGQTAPMKHVESVGNRDSITNKVNISVLHEGHNGSILYFDTNDNKNNLTAKLDNGHRFKIVHNETTSGILLDTQNGHRIHIMDKSGSDGSENKLDNNDQYGNSQGTFITLQSAGGHRITADDHGSVLSIILTSAGNHEMRLDDKEKLIQIRSTSGHTALMDDQGKRIKLTTAGGMFIDMDDNSGSITIQSKTGVLVI